MRFIAIILLAVAATSPAASADAGRFLLVDEVAVFSAERVPLSRQADAVERAFIAGATSPAGAPDTVLTAGEDGWITHDILASGYALATVIMPADTTLILDGMGYKGAYVNGEVREGNIYGYTDDWEPWQPHFDFGLVPVRLRAGENHLLFFGNRFGLLRARLWAAGAALPSKLWPTTSKNMDMRTASSSSPISICKASTSPTGLRKPLNRSSTMCRTAPAA